MLKLMAFLSISTIQILDAGGNLDESIENMKINFIMAAKATGETKYQKAANLVKSPENHLETLIYPYGK
jgi:hypothetical protein